ncbi:hypothetical protein C0081_21220 [Cohaesibacter celericrescens]|uniref:Uncharacterized protein n=1 Tax=Cohaesibacter celericrescens TaxID=2067669 RepID=A0A2N5XK22_9HYPH|nr:hypothetical protein C0081_21220 [Cohaesibacter celericrescens]
MGEISSPNGWRSWSQDAGVDIDEGKMLSPHQDGLVRYMQSKIHLDAVGSKCLNMLQTKITTALAIFVVCVVSINWYFNCRGTISMADHKGDRAILFHQHRPRGMGCP